jgi:hypothetical protein
MQPSAFSQIATLKQPSLAKALGSQHGKIFGRDRDSNSRTDSDPAHSDLDTREILPPGKLHREDADSALTGITRSLQRRLLGLRQFAKRRSTPLTPSEQNKKAD